MCICTYNVTIHEVSNKMKIPYVKNSLSISPIKPKLFKGCPCTSQIALNKQAFPFKPKFASISSAVLYKRALSPP